jgi:HAE1 family hydrophobic/amphiphilic exporter-1
MGTAVIGGMLAASLIAIFLIPVTFDVVESLTQRFRGVGKSKHDPEIGREGKEPA